MKVRFRMRNRMVLLGDLILVAISALGSFALRLDIGPQFVFYLPQAMRLVAIALLVKPLVFYAFGMYRRVWVYASIRELRLIVIAVTTASAFVSLIVVLLLSIKVLPYFPRSILPIDWLLTLALAGGLRFSMRVFNENVLENGNNRYNARRVLVVGAGDAGALVVREMQKNSHLQLLPVCFLDDDPHKFHQEIHGVPVVGKLVDLPLMLDTFNIHEVIIAIPSLRGTMIRQITDVCRLRNIPFRTMPGMYELIGGKVSVNRLRDVEIDDLLQRELTRMDNHLIGASLSRRRVLVTGAGGSIGRELCRQVARWGPSELVLVGHGENSIFEALLELQEDFPALPMYPVIGDVRDIARLQVIFKCFYPQVVFHAAAHKHVPLMESNVEEAITNNVIGTRNVVDVCIQHGVERMVMISTDKAIRPSSVMGASKRLAEMLVLDGAHRSGQPFSVVRFGNVLGSRGSVIPLFKRQISRGGPVTVTHPEMKRYFMTIPEAVHLVLQAFTMGQGGQVFVLNMGEQVRILDLAEDLIRLSGLEPGKDIEISFSGIRPGEKLSEELWDQGAHYEPTSHPDIVLLADQDLLGGVELQQLVNQLAALASEGNSAAILDILDTCIPGAITRSVPPPDLTTIV